MTLTGEVSGKTAILIDDMADTCGTLCTAAEVLAEHGTTQVVSVVTHGILSGDAIKKLNACTALSRVVVTNTVPLLGKNAMCDKIALIDISPTLAGKLFFFADICQYGQGADKSLQRLADERTTGRVFLICSAMLHQDEGKACRLNMGVRCLITVFG